MSAKKGEPRQVRKALLILPEDLYKRLRHESVDTDRTMSEIVTEALTKYFEKGGKRKE